MSCVSEPRPITFFCGNLPYRSGEEELRHLFESNGYKVRRVEVVRDRVTQRSRGIGFVEVLTASAGDVIEKVAGRRIRHREVRLEVSNSKKTSARGEAKK